MFMGLRKFTESGGGRGAVASSKTSLNRRQFLMHVRILLREKKHPYD
jgi:hypothetical protein